MNFYLRISNIIVLLGFSAVIISCNNVIPSISKLSSGGKSDSQPIPEPAVTTTVSPTINPDQTTPTITVTITPTSTMTTTPAVSATPTNTPTLTATPTPQSPAVISLNPNQGSALGGTLITITGSSFLNGATVKIGNTFATSVAVVSSTSITCLTPAGSAGSVSVTVINPDARSGSLSNAYAYLNSQVYTLNFDSLNASNFNVQDSVNGTQFTSGGPGIGGVGLIPINRSIIQQGTDFNFGTHDGTVVESGSLMMSP